jgi:uncharacterized membrane protein YphA (DoxX/SURF4 family)
MAQPRPIEPPELVPAPTPVAPVHAAFQILRVAFAALPLVAGIDKFFNVLARWPDYLAPGIPDLLGVSPRAVMHAVGVLEILAGLMVVFRPRAGGWLVAVWLWAVVANLLILPGYYDVALRDLALSLGAIALARLASRRASRE